MRILKARHLGLMILPFLALVGCNDLQPALLAPDDTPVFHGDDGEHSHGRYSHISWVPRTDISQYAVEFTYQAAFRNGYTTCYAWTGSNFASTSCTGAGGYAGVGDIIYEGIGATPLSYGDGTSTGVLFFQVTSANPSSITLENWIFGVAMDRNTGQPNPIHEYAGVGPYTAASITCCRVYGLQNPGTSSGSLNYGVQVMVTPGQGNFSALSNLPPIVNVAQGGVQTWSVPANSPAGNTLRWSMSDPAAVGVGGTQPADLTINSASGLKSWDTDGKMLGYYWSHVTIEEIDGTEVVGMVQVDYLIRLLEEVPDNNAPFFTDPPFCNASTDATVNELLSFLVTAQDPDVDDLVTLTGSGIPSGATFSPPAPANPISANFSWTPTTTGSRLVTFIATDPHGAQALCPVTINVVTALEPDPDPDPDPVDPENVQRPSIEIQDVTITSATKGSGSTADGHFVILNASGGDDTYVTLHDVSLTFGSVARRGVRDSYTATCSITPVAALLANGDTLDPNEAKHYGFECGTFDPEIVSGANELTATVTVGSMTNQLGESRDGPPPTNSSPFWF